MTAADRLFMLSWYDRNGLRHYLEERGTHG